MRGGTNTLTHHRGVTTYYHLQPHCTDTRADFIQLQSHTEHTLVHSMYAGIQIHLLNSKHVHRTQSIIKLCRISIMFCSDLLSSPILIVIQSRLYNKPLFTPQRGNVKCSQTYCIAYESRSTVTARVYFIMNHERTSTACNVSAKCV